MRAIYLWTDKASTPLSFFLPLVEEKARTLGWSNYTVFSDGWDEPEDWNMMVEYLGSTNRLTDVLFLNYARWHGQPATAKEELGVLHKGGVVLHSVQGFLNEVRNTTEFNRLIDVVSSWDYFQEVMSLKTREGMRHKRGGRLPFGLKREGDKVVQDENYPLVERVMGMHLREVPVPEIAKTMDLKQTKVRSIIRAWKDRFN